MRSIDNLREYALTAASVNATTRAVLAGYVDEIEREVEELRDRDYRNGIEDGEMAVERDGWVRLPVDADGVPIHVGDVMDNTHKDGFRAKSVIGMCMHSSGRWTVEVDEDKLRWHDVYKLRHHHAPTVEDVLREFTRDWCNAACAGDMTNAERDAARADTIAEYAAKLRLAGEDE